MNKEEICDTHIAPLVEQINAIYMKHGIAAMMNFAIPTEDEPDKQCLTMLCDGDGHHPDLHRLILDIFHAGGGMPPMTPMERTTEH